MNLSAKALASAIRWSRELHDVPLVLIGRSGTGKTHLARFALALRAQARAAVTTTLEPAADVINNFIAALRCDRSRRRFQARVAAPHVCRGVEHLEDLVAKEESRRVLFGLLKPAARCGLVLSVTTSGRIERYAPLLRDLHRTFATTLVVRLR